MFSALKRTLFDYSDGCKQEILYLLKKTCVFLIVGLILFPFMGRIEWLGGIGGICLIIFGFQWGRGLLGAVDFATRLTNNGFLKWMILIIGFGIVAALGYIYFLWCMIKLIVILIKNRA